MYIFFPKGNASDCRVGDIVKERCWNIRHHHTAWNDCIQYLTQQFAWLWLVPEYVKFALTYINNYYRQKNNIHSDLLIRTVLWRKDCMGLVIDSSFTTYRIDIVMINRIVILINMSICLRTVWGNSRKHVTLFCARSWQTLMFLRMQQNLGSSLYIVSNSVRLLTTPCFK